MDFTLALTHFCEAHGPKSVLCTNVLPIECAKCQPSVPSLQRRPTDDPYLVLGQSSTEASPVKTHTHRHERVKSNVGQHTSSRRSSGLANIEQHPHYRRGSGSKEVNQYPYGRAHGEICASCSLTVPQVIAAKLPDGAPGSLSKDGGKPKNGAPVLRSTEFVCLDKRKRGQTYTDPSSSQESQLSSVSSTGSTNSHTDCHDHTLTYLTTKSPDEAENYAQLRNSVLRALSCEMLPRGMSEGPFCFGDSTTGYTIAYVFRVLDAKARGRRRTYAFIALAGKDAQTAFKACPMIWEAFATMAKGIENAAQRRQDEQELSQQQQQESEQAQSATGKSSYTEPSSFLTQRPRDPDGQPRRARETQPRSLAEITGDENIFIHMHRFFVAVLRDLGGHFGGMPIAEQRYRTVIDDDGLTASGNHSARVSTDMLDNLSLDDESPTAAPMERLDRLPSQERNTKRGGTTSSMLSASVGKTVNTTSTSRSTTPTPSSVQAQHNRNNSQCAPLGVDSVRQQQHVRV